MLRHAEHQAKNRTVFCCPGQKPLFLWMTSYMRTVHLNILFCKMNRFFMHIHKILLQIAHVIQDDTKKQLNNTIRNKSQNPAWAV